MKKYITVDELESITKALTEAPAKYVLPVLNFITGVKASKDRDVLETQKESPKEEN